ncbi:hypothetical protein EYC84_007221 [Monilinia fructicola]|uniref:Uncharacterized protein n=1 Tax=Monilinia fructicola TaxID=38448 RepID=A0A5M9K8N1_MONFR|nr:hypothetical protein EYC84_007221 [Monilinia fructicola]
MASIIIFFCSAFFKPALPFLGLRFCIRFGDFNHRLLRYRIPLVIPRFIGVRGVLSLDCGGGALVLVTYRQPSVPILLIDATSRRKILGVISNPLNPYVSMGSFGGCGSA